MSENETKSASPIPTVMCAQCCSNDGDGDGDGGGGGVGGGGLATTQCPALQVTSRMLRSPSHESVTTDLSLFSVSSIASDLRSANRLVTFKSYSDAQLTGRGPSPKPDSRQIQGNRFVVQSLLHDEEISHIDLLFICYTHFALGRRISPRFYGSRRRMNWSVAAVFCRQHWDCVRALVQAMCRSFPVQTPLEPVTYERPCPRWLWTPPSATPCCWSTPDSTMLRGPAALGLPWVSPWPAHLSFLVRMEEPRRSSSLSNSSSSRSSFNPSNLLQTLNRCRNYHRNHRHRHHHLCPLLERISSGPSIRKSDRITYDEG